MLGMFASILLQNRRDTPREYIPFLRRSCPNALFLKNLRSFKITSTATAQLEPEQDLSAEITSPSHALKSEADIPQD
jgi:hypothetical protein